MIFNKKKNASLPRCIGNRGILRGQLPSSYYSHCMVTSVCHATGNMIAIFYEPNILFNEKEVNCELEMSKMDTERHIHNDNARM